MIVSGIFWWGPEPQHPTELNGPTPTYIYWAGPNPIIRWIYEPAAPVVAQQNNAIFFGMNF